MEPDDVAAAEPEQDGMDDDVDVGFEPDDEPAALVGDDAWRNADFLFTKITGCQ